MSSDHSRRSVLFFLGMIVLGLSWSPSNLDAQSKSWQVEWEKTIEAAKKEGKVHVYKFASFEPLDVFQKTYPEIKVVGVTGRGGQDRTAHLCGAKGGPVSGGRRRSWRDAELYVVLPGQNPGPHQAGSDSARGRG